MECRGMTNKYILDSDYWLDFENPIACYFLGLFWADGYVEYKINDSGEKIGRLSMCLVKPDFEDIINFLQKKQWSLGSRSPKNRQVVLQCRTNNRQYINFLINNNYHLKSGHSAYEILSKIPDHLKHYWWRGYFDGDGWFGFDKGEKYCFGFSACLNQNWDFCEDFMQKLNINYIISKRETKSGNSSQITANNFDGVEKFANFIYEGYESDSLGLKRKYLKWTKLWQSKESSVAGYNRSETFRSRMQKNFKFMTPNGEILELTNLTKFCRDNAGFNNTAWHRAMSSQKSYKGYKLLEKTK